jgi:glycerol-3-phosphate dehydrogenase
VVLNATGPWSDAVRRLADPAAAPRLRPTKGVHLMVRASGWATAARHLPLAGGRPGDVRAPLGRVRLRGDHRHRLRGSPAEVRAEEEDVRYLLDSANGLFPEARLTRRTC